jgi:hypothetical protein
MEFDITFIIKDDPEIVKARVKYGTSIRSALITHGLNYLNPFNKYERPLPDELPLRGPATFVLQSKEGGGHLPLTP